MSQGGSMGQGSGISMCKRGTSQSRGSVSGGQSRGSVPGGQSRGSQSRSSQSRSGQSRSGQSGRSEAVSRSSDVPRIGGGKYRGGDGDLQYKEKQKDYSRHISYCTPKFTFTHCHLSNVCCHSSCVALARSARHINFCAFRKLLISSTLSRSLYG